jgi:uncharacterized phage-associated protein
VRKRLSEAPLSAARFNPAIRVMYQRLKEEGRPDKVTCVDVARKVLLIVQVIYKTGETLCSPALEET